jgi:hypothetical protein
MIVSSLAICSQQGGNVQLDMPQPPRVTRVRGTGQALLTTPDRIHKRNVIPDLGILCPRERVTTNADTRPQSAPCSGAPRVAQDLESALGKPGREAGAPPARLGARDAAAQSPQRACAKGSPQLPATSSRRPPPQSPANSPLRRPSQNLRPTPHCRQPISRVAIKNLSPNKSQSPNDPFQKWPPPYPLETPHSVTPSTNQSYNSSCPFITTNYHCCPLPKLPLYKAFSRH